MAETATHLAGTGAARARLADEALCLLLGAGLTLGLFIGDGALREREGGARRPLKSRTCRTASAISEAPPPKAEERTRAGRRCRAADRHRDRGVRQPGEARGRSAGPRQDHAAGRPAAARDDPVRPAPVRPEAEDGHRGRFPAHLPAERGGPGPSRGGQDDREGLAPRPRGRGLSCASRWCWSSTPQGAVTSIRVLQAVGQRRRSTPSSRSASGTSGSSPPR